MVSLSEATAALATTNATVALSVLSLAKLRLTQNFPGMFSFPFAGGDIQDGRHARECDLSCGTKLEGLREQPDRWRLVERPSPEQLSRFDCAIRAPARRSRGFPHPRRPRALRDLL